MPRATKDTPPEDAVTLRDGANGKTTSLQRLEGTVGPAVFDIRKLYAETGHFTYDPAFMSTASCDSKITFIDGDKGILLYRGYPIEVLAEHSDFLEVCYLLLDGELPGAEDMAEFRRRVVEHTMVHEQLSFLYRGFRRDAHPMAILVGVVGALSAFYHDDEDRRSDGGGNASESVAAELSGRELASLRLIAKMPTISAMAYKYAVGQPFIYPRNDLGYVENFLHMMFAVPSEDYEVNPVLAKALERIFILHADHEQNASTSTVRLAGSSGANPFGCIAAGIACLWGPAHGGANEAVLRMLTEIGSVKRIPEFLAKAKDKADPFRLMGFGHRVYKNFDPRATVLRETCHEVLNELDMGDEPMLALALELDRIAREDEYFVKRKLYPNVDFYSGIILRAMGFPTAMFTVLFALARTVGWIAQWKEMIEDPAQKIGRPRQLYTGYDQRDYVPMESRS